MGGKSFRNASWRRLLDFVECPPKNQLPKIWKQIEKAKDAVEVRTLVIDAIRAEQIDIDKHTSRVWFGEDIAEDIMKVRFSHGSIANVAKTDRGISVMTFIRWTAQEIYDMEEEEEERHKITHVTAEMLKKLAKKQRMPPTSYDTGIRVLATYSLFLKVLLGTRSPHRKGVEKVRASLLSLSEREELVGADYLAHVYWLILDDSCRHFSQPLTPEAVRARYFNAGSVLLPGTTLNRLADKMACQDVLLSQTIPKQWLGRGTAAAAGYQALGGSRGESYNFPGVWQPPPKNPPYTPKREVQYRHPPFVMEKHEVQGRVVQLKPGGGGERNFEDRDEKAEVFRGQFADRYTGRVNTNVHPTIASMMVDYNKKVEGLKLSQLCRSAGVQLYRLPNAKGFSGTSGQLKTCSMFSLKICANALCKMAHLYPDEMDKRYPDAMVAMLSKGVAKVVTKPENKDGD